MNGGEPVAVWAEHSAIGHRYEELLADGTVLAWTEPPVGEPLHEGADDPDHNPICVCPGQWPTAFCIECAGCSACAQCSCPRPRLLGDDGS
ncbi:hypothetical protein ACFV0R_22240 [Streptomyces sp. NPDC059578]|uniref:hypothetical protein n=1 Tax=Streptomyces sp. NPDC059578 TaxID=3346874 RepID=UPI0036B6C32C